ncbi:MAG: hypothetical protein D6694_12625 [Gammaproteobacteria bacterium]|nr:MAG: hypothetical protein D6694_12625 [Gammaproteobacteria bacterium]
MSNVGDVLSESKNKALKVLAIFASIVVYVAGLLYAGVHNYTLMTKGVPDDLLIWAILGVVSLEISALMLPIALHWWTHSPLQRFAAFGFYLLDLGLLFFNVVTDYGMTAGMGLPAWSALYLTYIVPATPLLAAAGWSLIWLLDPSERERAMVETLKASTREALASRIAVAAKEADVNGLVEQAAIRMAFDIVGSTVSHASRRALPSAGAAPALVEGTTRPAPALDPQTLAVIVQAVKTEIQKDKTKSNGHHAEEAARLNPTA